VKGCGEGGDIRKKKVSSSWPEFKMEEWRSHLCLKLASCAKNLAGPFCRIVLLRFGKSIRIAWIKVFFELL
jgi:hypothetical protein